MAELRRPRGASTERLERALGHLRSLRRTSIPRRLGAGGSVEAVGLLLGVVVGVALAVGAASAGATLGCSTTGGAGEVGGGVVGAATPTVIGTDVPVPASSDVPNSQCHGSWGPRPPSSM